MATKLNPGVYDCHARALPDEPLFTLLGRDPIAPFLVLIWGAMRSADFEAAGAHFTKMMEVASARYWSDPESEKAAEALKCAYAMFGWRADNDGRWRDPTLATLYTGSAGTGRLMIVRTDGRAVIERDVGEEIHVLYRGCRMASLGPDPREPARTILAVEGGVSDTPGAEVEAVIASLSAEALVLMARDLVEAARAQDPAGAARAEADVFPIAAATPAESALLERLS